ncbi:hypothetical protein K2173_022152 [Erythroxylum novogranatense]|uniref:Uncharacterized protein n=1 Tax=Erythroxylum novogranatense TaxID=1862640 RepID=A0AAV8SU43_9ROSI|nr:hypothetical protein K2173_022152 [Erythroxylum novogranatense]
MRLQGNCYVARDVCEGRGPKGLDYGWGEPGGPEPNREGAAGRASRPGLVEREGPKLLAIWEAGGKAGLEDNGEPNEEDGPKVSWDDVVPLDVERLPEMPKNILLSWDASRVDEGVRDFLVWELDPDET